MIRKPTALLFLVAAVPYIHAAAGPTLAPLFSHIWRVANPVASPDPASIYIFLPGGTLLETSCVETYRVATWSRSPKTPGAIQVIEDGRPAFQATITNHTATTLTLNQTLLPRGESRQLSLTAIGKEFVCPDLPI